MTPVAPAPPQEKATPPPPTTTTTATTPSSSSSSQPRTPPRGVGRGGRSTPTAAAGAARSISGTETLDEDTIAADIGELLHAVNVSTITLTLYIPTTAVGAVIGRRGVTIAQLQKAAAAVAVNPQLPVRISVVSESHDTSDIPGSYSELDFSDTQFTPVVIRADPCAAFLAASKIQSTCPDMDDVVMDIPLQRSKHANVVGKRGITLQNLSADHNVRIMVPAKELRHDMVQLEGSLLMVRKCFVAMLRTVAQKSIVMTQLPSQVKIKQISRKTDTVIRKRKVDETTWQLTVTGVQVSAAVALLQKCKEETDGTSAVSPPPRRRTKQNGKGATRRKATNQHP